MDKDGELNVLHDILARDGDLDTMEVEDDASIEADWLSAESSEISSHLNKSSGNRGGSKHSVKTSASVGDEKLRRLAEERQRLEKENEEKKRRLEELRKQEMLIEEAATKGEFLDKLDKRIADIDDTFSHDSGSNEDDDDVSEDEANDVHSNLLSSYETLSEESGSCDENESDEDIVNHQNVAQSHGECQKNDSSRNKDVGKKHRVAISPVRWKKDENDSKDVGSKSENSRARSRDDHSSTQDRSAEHSRQGRLSSRIEKLYKYIFLDAKYFLMKSGNRENVALAQAKGVWSTPPQNEARLNQAFRTCSNVILIFSVKESGRFQGFARIAAESDRNHPPIRWVLPPGLTAKTLSGVFALDWINRNELDFIHTGRLNNAWNENQPIRVGRDGQAIEPIAAEALCRLFPVDRKTDLHAIALKSREAMDKHKLDPHELYKKQEAARRQAKIEQHRLKAKQVAEARRQQYRSHPNDERRLERLRNIVQKVASTIGVYNEFRRGYPPRSSVSSREVGRVPNSSPHREPYPFDRHRARDVSPFGYRDGRVGRPFVRSRSRDRVFDGGYARRPAPRYGRPEAPWHRMHDRRR